MHPTPDCEKKGIREEKVFFFEKREGQQKLRVEKPFLHS